MEKIISIVLSLVEPASILVLLAILLYLNSWVFKRMKSMDSDGGIVKKTISFLIILSAILAFILTLPIEQSLKGQILSFLAIIISAGIALSSTTVLGNVIAGIMNNSMNRFRNGDLIRIGDFQGRVTKKSIFHTEIQLEDSNFVTLPNLYIASNPVKLTRNKKTVISASVSLGYEVPRSQIEKALIKAASATGLADPFVYVMNLGDFSIEYKIHGFLDNTDAFFSTSSLLKANMLDMLHEKKIEIVSPTFMNQRRVDEKAFIPKPQQETTQAKQEASPEQLIFDEAIKSEQMENKKDSLKKLVKRQEELKDSMKDVSDEKEINKIKSNIERLEALKEKIEEHIRNEEEDEEHSPT